MRVTLMRVLTVMLCIPAAWVWAGSETGDNTLFGYQAGYSLGGIVLDATFIGFQAGYHTTNGVNPSDGKYNTLIQR